MYWVAVDSNSHIGRIGMDGTNRSFIVKDEIEPLLGLTIDFVNNHIYWAAGVTIEFANLDGTNRQTGETLTHAHNVLFFQADLYCACGRNSTWGR